MSYIRPKAGQKVTHRLDTIGLYSINKKAHCLHCNRLIFLVDTTSFEAVLKGLKWEYETVYTGSQRWQHGGGVGECQRPSNETMYSWRPTYASPVENTICDYINMTDKPTIFSDNPRKNYSKEDHYAEQLWDSDCNNCLHVKRIPFDRVKEDISVFGTPIICGLNGRQGRAYHTGIFSAHPCFVHRRTLEESPHKDLSPCERKRYDD